MGDVTVDMKSVCPMSEAQVVIYLNAIFKAKNSIET
jgi:hypothetical protein